MQRKTGIRNFIHHKYNIHSNFCLKEYESYLKKLKAIGIDEIEHAGSNIKYPSQIKRLEKVVSIIHELGLKAIFYTGVFGTVNLNARKELEAYVQRDKDGGILSYLGKGKTSAMICPASDYVDDYTIPGLIMVLSYANFDGIFIDIPWIMKKGCFCTNCLAVRTAGATNNEIVRNGLQKVVKQLNAEKPALKNSVNASAPRIHNESYDGASIENLNGLFDEYVTEWNPYRWGQPSWVVTKCIKYAKQLTNKRILHATTCTNKHGKLYTTEQYVNLFSAILAGSATPRLAIGFPENQLKIIGESWFRANEKIRSIFG